MNVSIFSSIGIQKSNILFVYYCINSLVESYHTT
nr:MAG TPA: hypothetical protein [Caudoviricetes sp.]